MFLLLFWSEARLLSHDVIAIVRVGTPLELEDLWRGEGEGGDYFVRESFFSPTDKQTSFSSRLEVHARVRLIMHEISFSILQVLQQLFFKIFQLLPPQNSNGLLFSKPVTYEQGFI